MGRLQSHSLIFLGVLLWGAWGGWFPQPPILCVSANRCHFSWRFGFFYQQVSLARLIQVFFLGKFWLCIPSNFPSVSLFSHLMQNGILYFQVFLALASFVDFKLLKCVSSTVAYQILRVKKLCISKKQRNAEHMKEILKLSE